MWYVVLLWLLVSVVEAIHTPHGGCSSVTNYTSCLVHKNYECAWCFDTGSCIKYSLCHNHTKPYCGNWHAMLVHYSKFSMKCASIVWSTKDIIVITSIALIAMIITGIALYAVSRWQIRRMENRGRYSRV